MTANLVDDPRERLNYFNGQRLAAADFRAEQGHHDGMRRMLNRSLYSAGIVAGLEVTIDPKDSHRVVVQRGLAFDYLGREIFLPAEVSVQAMGAPSTTKGLVFGNLLVISYREDRRATASERCTVAGASAPCSGDLAWGAPTRVTADVSFEVLDAWPADEAGKVVIAQLEMNASCQVDRVMPGARKYAMPVKPQKVRSISLEGEKDIDINNEKTLYFHIQGGMPERAVLILRARPFSSLYYSEIGVHTHPLALTIPDHADHKHMLTNLETDERLDPDTLHFTAQVFKNAGDYTLRMWSGGTGDVFNPGAETQQDLWSDKSAGGPTLRITNTKHTHKFLSTASTDGVGATGPLTHTFNKQETEEFGVLPAVPPPRQKKRDKKTEYTYVRNLHVVLDGNHDITDAILAQLAKRNAAQWQALGNGGAGHALATEEGTGEIDLLTLGFELGMGRHSLSFRVVDPKAGDADFGPPALQRGGQVQYNLYID